MVQNRQCRALDRFFLSKFDLSVLCFNKAAHSLIQLSLFRGYQDGDAAGSMPGADTGTVIGLRLSQTIDNNLTANVLKI